MSELLQWSAAIIVLAAFALSQRGIWRVTSYPYLSLNFVGGAGLPAAAALSHQWDSCCWRASGPSSRGGAYRPACAASRPRVPTA